MVTLLSLLLFYYHYYYYYFIIIIIIIIIIIVIIIIIIIILIVLFDSSIAHGSSFKYNIHTILTRTRNINVTHVTISFNSGHPVAIPARSFDNLFMEICQTIPYILKTSNWINIFIKFRCCNKNHVKHFKAHFEFK